MPIVSPQLWALGALAAFGILELTQRKGEAAKSLKTSAADRGSTSLIVFSYVVVATCLSLKCSDNWISPPWQWVFVVVAWSGVVLRKAVMRTLGAYYTRTLKFATGQKLITVGPYKYIRHPGYLSSLMIWGGAAAASGALVGALIAVTALLVAYLYRIRTEEQMLMAVLGETYEEYRKRSWRLLPFIF
ncbi:MAG: methyltransferase family protein [Nevskiales bacterium]